MIQPRSLRLTGPGVQDRPVGRSSRAGFAPAIARLVAARLVQAAATALVLATLCFGFVHALPGDTALRIAAARLGEDRLTDAAASRIRIEEGLDQPLTAQYAAWMGQLAHGDLGRSMVSRKPVTAELGRAVQVTALLGAAGWLLSYLIALPLGVAAGLRPGGWVDRVTGLMAVTLASLPSFLVGIGLIGVFALSLRWLPPAGARTGAHMVLPAITLALGLAAYSVRILRNAVAEVRLAFYMTFARIRGYGAAAAFRRHGVRNAAIPVAVFAALQLAAVVDGFIVVETLFAYPGLGDLLVKSLLARDVPVIMGAALVLGLSYALLNLVADLLCLWLDPQRRQVATGPLRPAKVGAGKRLVAVKNLRRIPGPAEPVTEVPTRAQPVPAPRRRHAMRSSLWLGLALLGVMAMASLAGPFVPGPDPAAQDLMHTIEPPGPDHPLGTDGVGRDVLSRVLHAAPRSLGIALLCMVVASSAGVTLGLAAAYRGGWVDGLIMRLADLMLALPGILLALLLAGFMGGGILPMLIGIKLALWPQFARMARATAIGVLAEPHVEAARLAGFRARTILRRHVLPRVLRQVTTLATLGVGSAIMSISALGFLGLGLQPPVPEWGSMINELLPYLSQAPIQVAAPCIAIFLSVLGCTLAGEALTAE